MHYVLAPFPYLLQHGGRFPIHQCRCLTSSPLNLGASDTSHQLTAFENLPVRHTIYSNFSHSLKPVTASCSRCGRAKPRDSIRRKRPACRTTRPRQPRAKPRFHPANHRAVSHVHRRRHPLKDPVRVNAVPGNARRPLLRPRPRQSPQVGRDE